MDAQEHVAAVPMFTAPLVDTHDWQCSLVNTRLAEMVIPSHGTHGIRESQVD